MMMMMMVLLLLMGTFTPTHRYTLTRPFIIERNFNTWHFFLLIYIYTCVCLSVIFVFLRAVWHAHL